MSDKRVDRFIESCVRCSFFSYEDIGEQEGYWCNRGERKLLNNYPEIPDSCPLPKLPFLNKNKIIQIQNILLAVSEKETGVILAMAKLDTILHEIGVEIKEVSDAEPK